ncbi:right-handed parallel beta-helix repeat-containing protein [Chloroflexota bacterium]
MLLKKENRDDYLATILSFLGRCLWNKKTIIIYLLAVFLIGLLFGSGISGFFGPIDNPSPVVRGGIEKVLSVFGLVPLKAYYIATGIWHENLNIPVNYFKGVMSNPEHIDIDIKFNDFQRLAYKRELALVEGMLFASDEDYVPAQIRYQGQTVDVRLRLKGDLSPHWSGDKWSLRVKTRGDNTLFGMSEFSIQDPERRGHLNEWLFHKAIEREGIIAPRYYFIDVTLNGKHKGIYALEEHFDKLLIEHNNRRAGPIVRVRANMVDAFQTGQISQDPVQYQEFLKAKDLLESFLNGSLETSQVFDIDKLARFMAICDVLSTTHATLSWNLNLYYNPITSKLEPISFDGGAFENLESILCEPDHPYYWQFSENAFRDLRFFEKYVQELERVSQTSYLDELFDELSEGLQNNLAIIHKDAPFFHFSKELFINNQNYIRNKLNHFKDLPVFFDHYSGNGTIVLEVGNYTSMPVEILGVTYKESQAFELKEPRSILRGRMPSEPVQYEMIELILPEDINWSNEYVSDLRMNFRLLGASQQRNVEVISWPRVSRNFTDTDLIRQEPNVETFPFMVVDNVSQKISVEHGNWEFSENLIIPAGYTVMIGEGTRLDLKNKAMILSYSPLMFIGSEDNPIIISSPDSSGQGIVVLNAEEQSLLENVIFKNLSAPSQSGWQLTGAISFYESPVKISGCQFLDNKAGDDMLNIIRSEFEISNSLFRHTLFDAIDVDFGKGVIANSSFVDLGNDGIDVSGSMVTITECFINGAGDKGVSVGENSQVSINQIELKNCYIAVASKDTSQVTIENIEISTSEVGLAVYQKKSEFGPSVMITPLVDMINVATPYLVEEGSTLLVNNQKIDATQKNVYQTLYGED